MQLPQLLPLNPRATKKQFFTPDVFVLTQAFARVFRVRAVIGDCSFPVREKQKIVMQTTIHAWIEFSVGKAEFIIDLMPQGGLQSPALYAGRCPLYTKRPGDVHGTLSLTQTQHAKVKVVAEAITQIAHQYDLFNWPPKETKERNIPATAK
jgi:hypothetical protein